VIRENLDLGRPKQMQLIFDRGITKATRIKQYHKAGQALRTETTIKHPRLLLRKESPKSASTSQDRVSGQPARVASPDHHAGFASG
jgi:hypothetical protein